MFCLNPNIIPLVDRAWTLFSTVFGQDVYADQVAWKYSHSSFIFSVHESWLSFSLNMGIVLWFNVFKNQDHTSEKDLSISQALWFC